jgi:hypothetical protein
MSLTQSIHLRCQHCRKWFRSPIFFIDSESFDTTTLFDTRAQCRHCGRLTKCDQDNLNARFKDGAQLGVEMID